MLGAVIVTHNRKIDLIKNLEMIYNQTIMPDMVYVVDNCSTDGTVKELENLNYFCDKRFRYMNTGKNIGGAGGFSYGTKVAYQAGMQWILLMDDDGRPLRPNTIEELMKKALRLYDNNKKIFLNSLVADGDILSFQLGNYATKAEAISNAEQSIIIGEANPFNGTLISRELVEEIGYPNADFFIKGDEVEYKFRARDAGALIATVTSSLYYHPSLKTKREKILGKTVPYTVEAPWKEYYTARNFSYLYRKNKQYKAIIFELFLVKTIAVLKHDGKRIKILYMVYRGLFDGISGKLGSTIIPGVKE